MNAASTSSPTTHASGDAGHGGHAHDEHIHPPRYYVNVYLILLALFAVSVAGPMLEIQVVTLVTAFGVAIIKAWLVASKFMHLNIERRYAVYILVTSLAFMTLFFFAVAPDVMKHEGQNWTNDAALEETARRQAEAQAGDAHGAQVPGGHDAPHPGQVAPTH